MAFKSTKTKLTQSVVNTALRNRDQPMIYRDTEVSGFQLRVSKRSATFYLDYKPVGLRPDGKQHGSKMISIGSAHSHSVAEARAAAAKLKSDVTDGQDPAATRKANKEAKVIEMARATTMEEAAERYAQSMIKGSTRHVTTESGALRNAIKEMKVEATVPSDVTLSDVMRMLDLNKGRACAVHRFGALNRFFDDLLAREVITENPCARVTKRHRPKPPQPRTRFYTAAEMRALWLCEGLSEVQLRLLRAMMLLPLRFSEACDLVASEVETQNGRIVLSEKRTKNGDLFAMPVPAEAMAMLSAPANDGDPRVFALTEQGKPFTSWTSLKNKVRKGSGVEDFNFHDLRRTFMTVLAEQGVGDPTVADALLNHRQSTTRAGVLAAYNHATLWPQKVRMMDAWAALLERAVASGDWGPGDSAVPFRRLGG
ncbi:tyrosine-type recombinase/integrase [Thalassovita sp.]|uniref:tyrosine-type recombinase/integrase n=1 Tax=Thalassovita sp. TaxID=1979401 RepID=UPI002AAF50FE|nr:integrase arm-type DNA-binding domain-containing protein [Thalassovita sp.]